MSGFIKMLFTAFAQSITSFLYLLILLMGYAGIKRNVQLEESWLGSLRNTSGNRMMDSMLFGMIAGLISSTLIILTGIPIHLNTLVILLPFSLFLTLLNKRYLCLSYAGGILSLVSLIFGWPDMDVPSLLALIGILHLTESLLIMLDGQKEAVPVVMEHKRFKPIGAFAISKFWPVPLVILTIPSGILQATGGGMQMPDWWPLFGGQGGGGLMLFPIAVLLEYNDLAVTARPEHRARKTGLWMGMYSLLILTIAVLSVHYGWLMFAGAVLMPLLHEFLLYWSRKGQLDGDPIFGAPWRGLRILEVMPDTVGSQMGLRPGDILLNLNGRGINSEEMLQEVLRTAPMYLWIDYKRDGKPETAEYHSYHRDEDSMGILYVPRKTSRFFRTEEQKGPLLQLWKRIQRMQRQGKDSNHLKV